MASGKTAKNSTSRRAPISFTALLLIAVMIVAVGWQMQKLQAQVAAAEIERDQYEQQVAEIKLENETLRADIAAGDTTEKMEQIAREQLGLVTRGEYVFYDVSN